MRTHQTYKAWLKDQVESLTDNLVIESPSEWAERKRYLPPATTSMPGFYRFDVAPYLKEIVDCFSPESPVREVAVMKGVQLGLTVGVLENAVGYCIDHVKTSPMMMITADAELAKLRMESNVIPMIQHSGLEDLIRSTDETNARKTGRALDLNTLIPTPNGLRPLRDLGIGDLVYAADGTPARIDAESPDHIRPSYKVTLSTGETLVASDDHRWVCIGHDQPITTRQMHDRGGKWTLVSHDPTVAPEVDLPVRPYTLGAWLGDGTSTRARIRVAPSGYGIVQRIQRDGYTTQMYQSTRDGCPMYAIQTDAVARGPSRFLGLLRAAGVLGDKHIPEIYFRSSIEQRMELLRGLMDTDGHIDPRGRCSITQKNARLGRDIWRLVCSLGYPAKFRKRKSTYRDGKQRSYSHVSFYADGSNPVCCLSYKAERLRCRPDNHQTKTISISGIEPVGDRLVKCIGIDHPSHLFLAGISHAPTHNTDKKIEWVGGGFLIPFGAQNANKLRSIPIQHMLRDEIDAWPDVVGKDGDPLKLSMDRTAAYEASRKIFDVSTPLIKGASKIESQFKRGDQRYYYVRCLGCGFSQTLRWRRTNPDTGEVSGIVWEMDNGRLVPDSVRYICVNCGHAHTNDDKTRLLSPDNGAEWRPTAEPVNSSVRSYHINALYSPVGMQTWGACVQKWLDAWDDETGRAKDLGSLQVFYNNVLGLTFELRGEKLKFEMVSPHRRSAYKFGQIPNEFASQYCGSPILVCTAAIDVHKRSLAAAVFGWSRDRRAFLIDYRRFEGDTENLDDPGTWGQVRTLLEKQAYTDENGWTYRPMLTLIDSGYRTDHVYQFCAEYNAGVYPCKGREYPPKSAHIREFSSFNTPMGTIAYGVTVDMYKDRWSAALRRRWDGQSMQPIGHFNAPHDVTDAQLKELTVETKREKIERSTGKRVGFEWHRPSGAANELWDLLIYSNAALDMIAWDICRNQMEMEFVNWPAFWDWCSQEKPFFDF